MKIGIIGSGNIGATLARHLAGRGHQVSIANSRGPQSLTALAAEIGAKPTHGRRRGACGRARDRHDPGEVRARPPRGLFAKVPDSVVVVDTGNYYPELRDGRIEAIDRGQLDSRWVEQQLGRPVIKAFNNIYARSLLEKGKPRGTPGRVALPVAGDAKEARDAVLRLVDEIGFDPIDNGALDDSWRQQPGTPAYCRDLDAGALKRALAQAERSRCRVPRRRAEAQARTSTAWKVPNSLGVAPE
jgi:predicted dinucleotide-binding enzyme